MKTKKHISSLFFIAIIAISCSTKKTVTEETDTKTGTTVKETTFDSTGYTEGTIVQSKSEGDCEWSIELKDGKYIEAMDINKDFLIDGTTVWIKYSFQRRMQRCEKAAPVAINEMILKE